MLASHRDLGKPAVLMATSWKGKSWSSTCVVWQRSVAAVLHDDVVLVANLPSIVPGNSFVLCKPFAEIRLPLSRPGTHILSCGWALNGVGSRVGRWVETVSYALLACC